MYRSLSSLEGVERVVASFKEGHITAWIDPTKTNREVLVTALKKTGVDVVEPKTADKPKTEK
jgi:copper chaperone CopZ